jgi:phosphopantothenoylcysteine decarboxylase/phosphopantothenate--cysteine ligase
MFKHPAMQENLRKLTSFGNIVVEPASGELASGLSGKGRMEEPEVIVAKIVELFSEKKNS